MSAGTTKQELTNSCTTNTLQVSIPERSITIIDFLSQTILREQVPKNKLGEQQISPLLEGQRIELKRKGRLSMCEYNYN